MQLPSSRLPGPGPCSQHSRPLGSGPLTSYTHLLVLPIMAGDCPMSSLSLNGLPIRTDQHRCHQTKGAKA